MNALNVNENILTGLTASQKSKILARHFKPDKPLFCYATNHRRIKKLFQPITYEITSLSDAATYVNALKRHLRPSPRTFDTVADQVYYEEAILRNIQLIESIVPPLHLLSTRKYLSPQQRKSVREMNSTFHRFFPRSLRMSLLYGITAMFEDALSIPVVLKPDASMLTGFMSDEGLVSCLKAEVTGTRRRIYKHLDKWFSIQGCPGFYEKLCSYESGSISAAQLTYSTHSDLRTPDYNITYWLELLFPDVDFKIPVASHSNDLPLFLFVQQMVDSAYEKVKQTVSHGRALVSELVQQVTNWLGLQTKQLKTWMGSALTSLSSVLDSFSGALTTAIRLGIFSIILWLIFISVTGIKWIGEARLLSGVANAIETIAPACVSHIEASTEKVRVETYHDAVSHGPSMSPGVALAASIGSLLGLGIFGTNELANKMRQLSGIMGGALVGATVCSQLLAYLPVVCYEGLLIQTSTPQDRLRTKYTEWQAQSVALIRLQHIPDVVSSASYRDKLYSLIQTFKDLPRLSSMDTSLSQTFTTLVKLSGTVAQFASSSNSRVMPFCVHLFGAPGVCKSLAGSKIARDVTGKTKEDTFYVPAATEFWDGYRGQSVIIQDEFLVGNMEIKQRQAGIWLNLASTSTFIPPLASTDNIIVGMKGTTASNVKFVATLNNSSVMAVGGYDTEAINRRYNFKVKLEPSTIGQPHYANNTFDLSKFTPDQIANLEFLQFTLVSKMTGYDASKPLTYKQLLTVLKHKYEEHISFSNTLNDQLDQSSSLNKTPQQVIEETIADVHGVPAANTMWYEYLAQSFTSVSLDSLVNLFSHGGRTKNRNKRRSGVRLVAEDSLPGISSEENDSLLGDISDLEDDKTADLNNDCTSTTPALEVVDEPVPSLASYKPEMQTLGTPIHSNAEKYRLVRDKLNKIEAEMTTITEYDEYAASLMLFMDSLVELPEEEAANRDIPRCLVPPPPMDLARVILAIDGSDEETLIEESCSLSFSSFAEYAPMVVPQHPLKTTFLTPVRIGLLLVGLTYLVARWLGREDVPDKVDAHDISNPDQNGRNRQEKLRRSYGKIVSHGLQLCFADISFNGTCVGGTFVDNQHIVTVKHTLASYPIGAQVHVSFGDIEQTVTIDESNRRYVEGTDLGCLILPKPTPNVTKITSFFLPAAKLQEIDYHQLVFMDPFDSQAGPGQYKEFMLAKYNNQPVEIRNCVVTNLLSEPGYCGYPYVMNGGLNHGRIWAINVAGGPGLTVGAIITKEQVEGFIRDPLLSHDSSNIVESRIITQEETVHITRETKCRLSEISPFVNLPNELVPPLLKKEDPRNPTPVDPGRRALEAYGDNTSVCKFTQEQLDAAKNAIKEDLVKVLDMSRCMRELSLDDAVKGVTNELNPVNRKTCPGYPLMKSTSNGKTSMIPIGPDGSPLVTPALTALVAEKEREMFGEEPINNHRFVAFMKDEPTKASKVAAGNVRLTFCGDMITSLVVRKKIGSVLGQLTSTSHLHGLKVGINQYSTDMDILHNRGNYLYGGYCAEDVKGMDRTLPRQLLSSAIELICELACLTSRETEAILSYALDSQIQFEDTLMRFHAIQASGTIFTTHGNSLAMMIGDVAIIQNLYPVHHSEVHCADYLGDDVVRKVASKYGYNSIVRSQQFLTNFGMTLTSDEKDKAIDSMLRSFEDVTFLGAKPIKYNGKWVGVPVDKTVQRMLHWTTSQDMSTKVKLDTLFYMCSFDPKLVSFLDELSLSLRAEGLSHLVPDFVPWEVRRQIQASRSAYVHRTSLVSHAPPVDPSGDPNMLSNNMNLTPQTFDGMMNEEFPDETSKDVGAPNSDRPGLMKFLNMQSNNVSEDRVYVDRAQEAVSAMPMKLNYGTESVIPRVTVPWYTADVAGKVIWSARGPLEVLALGDQTNLQNMPFSRFVFWRGLQSLTLTINAMRFANGILLLGWAPLTEPGDIPEIANWRMIPHVLLQPNRNTTVSLTVPFQFYRQFLNLNETLANTGTWFLGVLSPLFIDDTCGTTQLNVRIASSFPKASFVIPKPTTVATQVESNHVRDVETMRPPVSIPQGVDLQSHGWFDPIGKMVQSVKPFLLNLGGDVGRWAVGRGLDFLGLDNPLNQRTSSVQTQYVGNSKIVGEDDCVDMQLYPGTAARNEMSQYNPKDDSIAQILSRPCLLTRFTWKACDEKASLLNINLSSVFDTALGAPAPLNIALLNHFYYWRANVVFTIIPVRNSFQSGRLLATVAYQCPSITGTENAYYQNVLDFSEDNYEAEVEIAWNAATSFLRTEEGKLPAIRDPIENYSLGRFNIGVYNPLIAASTTSDNIEVLVYISFKDVVVAEPRPFTQFTLQYRFESNTTIFANEPIVTSVTTPPDDSVVIPEETQLASHEGTEEGEAADAEKENKADNPESTVRSVVTDARYVTPTLGPPSSLDIGHKFEFYPKTFSEIARRGVLSGNLSTQWGVFPITKFNLMYRGWIGGIRYNMFFSEAANVMFTPEFNVETPGAIPLLDATYPIKVGTPSGGTQAYIEQAGIGGYYNGKFELSIITGAATERSYATADSASWIKINCPFKQTFNMCSTTPLSLLQTVSPHYFGRFPVASGAVYTSKAPTTRYTSGSDDFRFCVFCPPKTVYRKYLFNETQDRIGGIASENGPR